MLKTFTIKDNTIISSNDENSSIIVFISPTIEEKDILIDEYHINFTYITVSP